MSQPVPPQNSTPENRPSQLSSRYRSLLLMVLSLCLVLGALSGWFTQGNQLRGCLLGGLIGLLVGVVGGGVVIARLVTSRTWVDERFSDRARRVLQRANQEAKRFNHEYVGTEHILLGLLKECSGIEALVLEQLRVDSREVRNEVEKIVQTGPDMVTVGLLPLTPRSANVLAYSLAEARDLGHDRVGSEHLLLGLLREQHGVAAQVLMSLGLKLEDVRQALRILGKS